MNKKDKYENVYVDTDIILNSKDVHGGYVMLIQSRGYGRRKAIEEINKKFGVNRNVKK